MARRLLLVSAMRTSTRLSIVALLSLSACVVGEGGALDSPADDPSEPTEPTMPDGDPSDPDYEDETEVEHLVDVPYDDTGVQFEIAAAGNQMRVCGATALNHRAGPGTEHAVLRVLDENTLVKVIATEGNWVRGEVEGDLGWSHSRYLCSTEPPPSDPTTPEASASESINRTNGGRLRGAVRLGPHPRWIVADTGRNAAYATAETVEWLTLAFDTMEATHPGGARPQVRDISVQAGGRPAGYWPHASHQSGRDVDITYPQRTCSATTGCPPVNVSTSTMDVAATWTMIEPWLTEKVAHRIFIDRGLHPALRAEATRRGRTRAELDKWFGPVIMHVNNHLNHLHVRFRCPADDDQCVN